MTVGEEPVGYRHRLGRIRDHAWNGLVGWPVLSLGVLVDLSAITVMNDRQAFTSSDQVGGVIVGVGLTALGIWLIRGAIVEHQPGSGTQWLLAPPPSGDSR